MPTYQLNPRLLHLQKALLPITWSRKPSSTGGHLNDKQTSPGKKTVITSRNSECLIVVEEWRQCSPPLQWLASCYYRATTGTVPEPDLSPKARNGHLLILLLDVPHSCLGHELLDLGGSVALPLDENANDSDLLESVVILRGAPLAKRGRREVN